MTATIQKEEKDESRFKERDLSPARRKGESYEDYCARRKRDNEAVRDYLDPLGAINRHTLREMDKGELAFRKALAEMPMPKKVRGNRKQLTELKKQEARRKRRARIQQLNAQK